LKEEITQHKKGTKALPQLPFCSPQMSQSTKKPQNMLWVFFIFSVEKSHSTNASCRDLDTDIKYLTHVYAYKGKKER